jgi:hypothetical protein
MRTYKTRQFLWLLPFLFLSSAALAISPDAYEDDNSSSQAKLILPNDSAGDQLHNFHSADDADWVKFYGIAEKFYRVRASNPGADCDVAVELYDSSGNRLLGPIDDVDKGGEEYFEWRCPADGFYFIKAYFAAAIFLGDKTNYALSVEDMSAPMGGKIDGLVQKTDFTTAIVGAKITASATNGSKTVYSNGIGYYSIPSLEAGVYNLTVTASGYKSVSISVTVSDGLTSNGCVIMYPEDTPKTYYKDADRDGYGDPNNSIQSSNSTPPAGYVNSAGDCNDNDPSVHPTLSLSDVIAILKILSGMNTAPPICLKDYRLGMSDAIHILQIVAGLR